MQSPDQKRVGEMDNNKWMELAFSKRECQRYVPSTKDVTRCACGQTWAYHKTHGVEGVGEQGEVWSPTHHTISSPTDAFGTIDFLGGPHPNKAQFIRLSFDSRSDLILQLLTREWGLELPKLIISVHGGKANFELSPRLKKVLRKGLLRAAKTTGAWVITGGTNTGVTRHVGDALISERSPRLRGGRVVSIGIAPWGVVENRQNLVGRKKDVTYLSIDQPRSKFAVLNNRHAYFLLVDNGTVGRYGAEIALRRKLEKYISSQRLPARTHCSIPVVCVVIEGGMHTIRTVLEYVTDSPPVPVVVCEGSGRAADLIAFTHKYALENGESSSVLDEMKEQLIGTIQRTFSIDVVQAEKLYAELLQCVKKKNLITIFRPSDSANSESAGDGHELDQAILSALFRSRHLSAPEQLSLALAWNRVDIARSEIFVYGQEWPEGALEEAMMDALVKNRVDFVKLLLETGVQMTKFLTIPRLEELYNSKQGPANTLRYIVRDVRPHMPRNYSYTLIDIGLVINKLMGGAYRSSYTRRKFRSIYSSLMKKPIISFSQSALGRVYSNHLLRNGGNNLSLVDEGQNTSELTANMFAQPFNELLVWAVLTKRQAMAQLMWQHGEEALAKALIASKLYRAMAHEAADDDLEVEIYDELRGYAAEFETEALELLDYSYRQDDDLAQQLLTCELPNWSRQTCLRLAFACNHRTLLAHPCSQVILGDLWMGGLRTRRSTNLKVILSLLCPPIILRLEFKSKEELQLMPQTEEEHLIDLKEENSADEYNSSSSSSSSSSTPSHSPCSERSLSHQKISVAENLDNALSTQKEATNTSKEIINGETTEGGVYERRRNKQLRIKKKFYEFYAAPITKFWSHSMAFVAFLMIYTYTVLVRLPQVPEWNEYYIIAYILTFGGEKIREILASEPVKLSQKFSVWSSAWWNCCDAGAVIEFLVAMVLRFNDDYFAVGRVLYCLNIVFWYIRILRIFSVSKFLGPFVTMIGKMLKKMIYYVILLAVVLMAYGVFRQSLLYPKEEPHWRLGRNIFFQPYFMIYGELFAGVIDDCGSPEDGKEYECVTGHWLNPLLMTCYLLVTNILLLNLLIAVFNSIFLKTNAFSHQIWKFNRFYVVMEYEQKPALPPPLIIFSHIYLIIKWCRRRTKGMKDSYDHGLKLFLNSDDLERLYDFEEECMEGLAREKETKLQMSTEERVRVINERLDVMGSKFEDSFQKAALQNQSLQALDFRMLRLEEVAEQTSASLAVIHRFMAFQQAGFVDADPMNLPRNRDKTKSSLCFNFKLDDITPDEFSKHLSSPTERAGRRSSCAYESENVEGEGQFRAVEPQDLAMLKSMGPVARFGASQPSQSCLSNHSNDGNNILMAMEEAERDLANVSAGFGRHAHTPASEELECSPRLPTKQVRIEQIRQDDDDDDDLATTGAVVSPGESEPSLDLTMLSSSEEDEITEVFDSDHPDGDVSNNTQDLLLPSSPAQRSYSVGGQPELRNRRFRNWSGTPTSSVGASPRNSRRRKSPQSPAAPSPADYAMAVKPKSSEGLYQPSRTASDRRRRLQSMHSCPAGHKWNSNIGPSATCGACQLIRSSLSYGSFNAQQTTNMETPKMNLIPPSPLSLAEALETAVNPHLAPLSRTLSAPRNPSGTNKVEAEAEHLREMEGQDYHMMEGIIRRRLHRDSENLDVSLEDLCNAPMKNENLDSVDEGPEFSGDATNFIVGDSIAVSDSDSGDEPLRLSSVTFPAPSTSVPGATDAKASGDVSETHKKVPPARPPQLPIRKQLACEEWNAPSSSTATSADPLLKAPAEEHTKLLSVDNMTMSRLIHNAKNEEDIKISIEDEEEA